MGSLSPVVRGEAAAVSAVAAALDGVVLSSVRYVMSSETNWPSGYRRDVVHEVDHGVELGFDNGQELTVAWAMSPATEGLALVLRQERPDDRAQAGLDGAMVRFDLSDDVRWSPLAGSPVTEIGAAWHDPRGEHQECLFALRVTTGRASAVVTLGEDLGNGIQYLPTNLLVIFDEVVARGYGPGWGAPSAWGERAVVHDQ